MITTIWFSMKLNKIIYHMIALLFSLGFVVYTDEKGFEILFVMGSSSIYYFILLSLFRERKSEFRLDFYKILALIFDFFVLLILFLYREKLSAYLLFLALLVYIFLLASQKYIINEKEE